jgi:hypothetical protein
MWDNNYSGIKIEGAITSADSSTAISGDSSFNDDFDGDLTMLAATASSAKPVVEDHGFLFSQYEALSPTPDRPFHKIKLVLLGGSG